MASSLMLFLATVASFALQSLAAVPAPTPSRPSLEKWEEGKAAEAGAKAVAAANEQKKSAVSKAVELLETLQAKVLAEGEAEAQTYNKFACFCKDTTAEKLQSIQKGTDDKTDLIADLNELASRRDTLDANIQNATDTIANVEADMEKAKKERSGNFKVYEGNSEDLKGAISALENAIKTLKAGKTPETFAQVAQTVRHAVQLADIMGLTAKADKKVMALLQEPENGNEVPMEDYDFHSDGIISTLEKLLGDFRTEKIEVDKDEAASLAEHEKFMQRSTDRLEAQNKRLEADKEKRGQTVAELETTNQRLTTVEAILKDDKEYTNELSKMCSDKAKTWDQRSRVRSAELSTLTQAIGIIKGAVASNISASTLRFLAPRQAFSLASAEHVARTPSAMRAIEQAAEEDEASFLQTGQQKALVSIRRLRGGPSDDGRDFVASLLRKQGESLKSSALITVATQLVNSKSDPFGKVKVIIQQLIERLLKEANDEANHKGFCDKALSDAKQKRDYAAEKVRDLNSEMAKLESVRDALSEELSALATQIDEIKTAQKTAKDERLAEKAQNAATVEEAKEGLDALKMCMDLLDKFYKTIAKESVDLSLAQKGPADDAPDAGFDNGEAYLGAQSENGGILGMLDVMKSDFERTISETEAAEEQAQQDFLEFMTESGKSLAAKTEAESAKKEQLDNADEQYEEADSSINSQTSILRTSIQELIELQPVCIDTGMSYEDRVALRREEIAALNKAACILEKYAEYGPDGAADSC